MQDAGTATPILIFLSPGVDAAAAVESLGRKHGFTLESSRYASVSLGQGQEDLAMSTLKAAKESGGWVLLQNIHLTMDWTTKVLEKVVDGLGATREGETTTHPNFQ